MDLGPNYLYKMLRTKKFDNIILLKESKLKYIQHLDIYLEPFGASFNHISSNVIDSGIIIFFVDLKNIYQPLIKLLKELILPVHFQLLSSLFFEPLFLLFQKPYEAK